MSAEANLSSVAKIAETEIGVTPDNPELTIIGITGESLKNAKETVASQTIRADRQVPDLAKVALNPEGGYEFELNYGDYDQELRGGLGATEWSNHDQAAGDVAFDSATQTLVDNGGGGIYSDLVVGGLLTIANAEDEANNGHKRVMAVSPDGNTVTFAPGSIVTTNAGDEAATTKMIAIANGREKPSLTLEKEILNNQNQKVYQVYRGMVIDTLNISIESRAIITGSVTLIGLNRTLGNATVDTNGVYTQPTSNPIMNGTNNVGTIKLDGQAATERFKSLSIEISNNLRGKDAIGTEGNFDIGTGTFQLTGTLSSYFFNNDFLAKIDDHTSFSLETSVTDPEGNAYHFFMPNCKTADGDPMIESINSDVMLDMQYQAILSREYGITFAITKIPAS